LTKEESLRITGHLSLAQQIAKHLKHKYCWVDYEEAYSYALLGLVKAAQAYDETRGVAFVAFATHKGLFAAVDEMRKDGILHRSDRKSQHRLVSLDSSDVNTDSRNWELIDPNGETHKDRMEARDWCAVALGRLKNRDRRLILMYYADDMTFREIGEVLGISESAVCLRHQMLIGLLRKLARKGPSHLPMTVT